MRIRYFEETDTLYIEFKPADVAETRDLDENTDALPCGSPWTNSPGANLDARRAAPKGRASGTRQAKGGVGPNRQVWGAPIPAI